MKIKRVNKRRVDQPTLEEFLIENDMALIVMKDYTQISPPGYVARLEDSKGLTLCVKELQNKIAGGAGVTEYEAIVDLRGYISGRSLVANGEYTKVPILSSLGGSDEN